MTVQKNVPVFLEEERAHIRYLSQYVADDNTCLVQERNSILVVWITFFALVPQFSSLRVGDQKDLKHDAL